jgi:hypothetical protein
MRRAPSHAHCSSNLATVLAIVAIALVGLAAPAAAHVVSDRELAVVAQFPAGFAGRTLMALVPDSLGYVAPNRAGSWRDVGYQRGAMLVLVDAAARADTVAAERAWRAIDVAFAHQHPPGGFDTRATLGVGDSTAAAMADEAAWLAGVCRGFVAVMNSRLQDRFRWRYALLKPKLQRSVDHLERHHDELLAAHARHPDALLAIAAAFLLADGTTTTLVTARPDSRRWSRRSRSSARTARSRPRDARTSRVTRRHSARSSRW